MENYRIINYPWHISHQYSLVQIPNTSWSWVREYNRGYSDSVRGNFVDKYGIKYVPYCEKGKHDVGLLHLDQQCFEAGIWKRGKGKVFQEMKEAFADIPKIVIMHGTPYYPEMFKSDITEDNFEAMGFTKDQIGMSSELIRLFHEAIQGIDYVIFNSKTAAKQWGVTDSLKGRAIWHGLEASEWLDLPKEPRVVTMLSPGGLDRYYDRSFLRAVKDELEIRSIYHCHITVDVQFKSSEEYKDFLGRSLIYFNPTKESPMPRSRTEAMLSGCCILTTPSQDADMFIKDGENGLIIPRNPEFVADIIEALIHDYKKAVELGQAGKKTAIELFNKERFEKEWREVLDHVVTNYKK